MIKLISILLGLILSHYTFAQQVLDTEPTLVVPTGHTERINNGIFCHKGDLVVTSSEDKILKVWDSRDGKYLRNLKGAKEIVNDLLLSQDDRYVIGISTDLQIYIWDIAFENPIQIFSKKHSEPIVIAESIDGDEFVTYGLDGKLIRWSIKEGYIDTFKNTPNAIAEIKYHKPINSLIMRNYFGEVFIINLDNNNLQKIKVQNVSCLNLKSQTNLLFLGTQRGEIYIYDLDNLEQIHLHKDGFKSIRSIQVCHFNNNFYLSNEEGIKEYIYKKDSIILNRIIDNRSSIDNIILSSSDSILLAFTIDNKLIQYNTKTLYIEDVGLSNNDDDVIFANFSNDGIRFLYATSTGDVKVKSVMQKSKIIELNGYTKRINIVKYSPGENKIIYCYVDGTIVVWDNLNQYPVHFLKDATQGVSSISFNKSGMLMLTSGRDKKSRLWNIENGKLLHTFEFHKQSVYATYFSSNENFIISSSSDNSIVLWDAQTYEKKKIIQAPDDSIFIELENKKLNQTIYLQHDSIVVIDKNRGKITFSDHFGKITNISLSNNGQYLISCGYDKNIVLYDLNNLKKLKVFTGHTDYVYVAMFDINDSIIYSGSRDRTIKAWDVKSGNHIFSLNGHKYAIVELSLSEDGTYLNSRTRRGGSRLWHLPSKKFIKELSGDKNYRIWNIEYEEKYIATNFLTNVIYVYDIHKDKFISTLNGHDREVTNACFINNGYDIITSGNDRTILWNIESNRILKAYKPHDSLTYGMHVFNNEIFMTYGLDNKMKFWNHQFEKIYELPYYGNLSGIQLDSFNFKVDFTVNPKDTLSNRSYYYRFDLTHDTLIFVKDLEVNHKLACISIEKDQFVAIKNVEATLYSRNNANKLYSFWTFDDNNYLVRDTSGRYDGSHDARKKLYLSCGNEIIDLAQIKDALFVPGLALKMISGLDINYKKISDLEICGVFPLIYLLEETGTFYNYRIKQRKAPIQSIEVWINDKRIMSFPIKDLFKSEDEYHFYLPKEKIESLCVPGQENRIKVNAVIDLNGTEAKSRGAILTLDAFQSMKSDPHLYTLMIGVNDYKSELLNLRYPAKDAYNLGIALDAAAKKLLGNDKVHSYFVHSNIEKVGGFTTPEKEGIRRALKEIGQKSKPEDVLILFFAGHGKVLRDDDTFILLTAESSENILEGISTQELMDWVSPTGPHEFKANKTIFIFDACHSGKGAESMIAMARDDRETERRRKIDDLSEKSGMFILAASAADQSAFELHQFEQGLLTYCLLHTLKNNPNILDDGYFLNIQKWFLDSEKYMQDLIRTIGLQQQAQPYGSANIRIGMVDDELRSIINLTSTKPVFIRSTFINIEESEDNLLLGMYLDDHLNNVLAKGENAAIIFVDAKQYPNSCKVSGSYTLSDNQWRLKGKLKCGSDELHFDLATRDEKELKEQLVKWVIDNLN